MTNFMGDGSEFEYFKRFLRKKHRALLAKVDSLGSLESVTGHPATISRLIQKGKTTT